MPASTSKQKSGVLDEETRTLLFGREEFEPKGLVAALSSRPSLDDLVQNPLTDLAAINERLDTIGELVEDAELRGVMGRAVAGLGLPYMQLYETLNEMATQGSLFGVERYAESIRSFIKHAAEVGKDFPASIGRASYKTKTIGDFAVAFEQFFASPVGAQVKDFFSYMMQVDGKIAALEQEFEKRQAESKLEEEQRRAQLSEKQKMEETLEILGAFSGMFNLTGKVSEAALRRFGAMHEGKDQAKWVFNNLDIKRLTEYAPALSRLKSLHDVIYPYHALAEEAVENNYVRPEVVARKENCLIIEGGKWQKDSVPNDTYLNPNTRVEVIEGVNNGGKTYDMRKALVIAVRALSGSWVPATKAKISVRDKITMRMKGTGSTMSALQQDCRNSNEVVANGEYSLVAMDETFRSTEARGGEALTVGLINTVAGIDSIVSQGRSLLIISSHYPNLSKTYQGNDAVAFTHFDFEKVPDEKAPGGFRLAFPHQKKPGSMTDYSYAIAVARSAKFNERVLRYAEQWLQRRQVAR